MFICVHLKSVLSCIKTSCTECPLFFGKHWSDQIFSFYPRRNWGPWRDTEILRYWWSQKCTLALPTPSPSLVFLGLCDWLEKYMLELERLETLNIWRVTALLWEFGGNDLCLLRWTVSLVLWVIFQKLKGFLLEDRGTAVLWEPKA